MLTITDIKSLLRQRKLGAVELVKDILTKLDANPFGATLSVNEEATLSEAKEVQKLIDSGYYADNEVYRVNSHTGYKGYIQNRT